MFDDIKAIKEMQRIMAGGDAKLSLSQIVAGAFNLKDMTQGLDKKTTNECLALYQKFRKCKNKEVYDAVKLMTEIEILQQSFDKIITGEKKADLFQEMYEKVQNFLLNEPFKDTDISYGFQEVCTFAAAEYLTWMCLGYEENKGGNWYYGSMVSRSDESTANSLIIAYDRVQNGITNNMKSIKQSNVGLLQTRIFYLIAFEAAKVMFITLCDADTQIKIISSSSVSCIEQYITSTEPSNSFEYNVGVLAEFIAEFYVYNVKNWLGDE